MSIMTTVLSALADDHLPEPLPRPVPNVAHELMKTAEEHVSALWCDRIVRRLAEGLDKELRDGLPLRIPDSGEQAMSIIKGVATELQTAAVALEQAARVLKDSGKGYQASLAYQAAQRAHGQARGLIGEA